MRRLLLPLLVLGALIAASCASSDSGGNGGGESAACPVDALDSAEGPVELVVWETFTAEPLKAMEALVAEYNASQDRVVVRMENQGVGYEEIQRKFNQAISTPDALPGLAVLEDTQTQFMADSGVVVPAAACAEAADESLDRFIPVVREFYTANDSLQPGMSQLSDAVMYLNKDHFRQAGLDPENPPQTLDEVRDAAQAIKDAGIPGVEEPFVMVLQPWFIEHWLTGAGATVVNQDNGREGLATESTFDNATTLEIYTWLAEMDEAGLLKAIPGTEGQVEHYFAVGLQQSSFTVETSSAVSTIDAFLEGTLDPAELGLDVESLPAADLDIGVAPYPGVEEAGRIQAGGGAWYITNTTPPEVQAAAWDFISWFNDGDQQVTWSQDSAYLPWNEEAIDSPQLQEYWTDTRRGSWTKIAYDQIASMDPESPGPLIGPYTETRTAIRTSLDRLILEGVSPADAISQADQEISAALEQYEDSNF